MRERETKRETLIQVPFFLVWCFKVSKKWKLNCSFHFHLDGKKTLKLLEKGRWRSLNISLQSINQDVIPTSIFFRSAVFEKVCGCMGLVQREKPHWITALCLRITNLQQFEIIEKSKQPIDFQTSITTYTRALYCNN